MKLFLTSSAANVLDKVVSMLPSRQNEMKVIFIPTAGDPYGDDKPWMEADRKKLVDLGFTVEDFDLKDKTKNKVRETLLKADIIFVAGGNTFYLLEKMQKSGFDKVLKEFEKSDKIYIGSSAGSIVLGPTLEPIESLDHPEKARLNSSKALGLVGFIIIPHYEREKYVTRHKEILKKFSKKYKLITLTDEQMVVVDAKGYEVV